jgi:hypothetical protein
VTHRPGKPIANKSRPAKAESFFRTKKANYCRSKKVWPDMKDKESFADNCRSWKTWPISKVKESLAITAGQKNLDPFSRSWKIWVTFAGHLQLDKTASQGIHIRQINNPGRESWTNTPSLGQPSWCPRSGKASPVPQVKKGLANTQVRVSLTDTLGQSKRS